MSEKVDQVVRALYKTFEFHGCANDDGSIDLCGSYPECICLEKAARAAIEAMREPTERMVDAVNEALEDCEYDAAYICRLVIDEALE